MVRIFRFSVYAIAFLSLLQVSQNTVFAEETTGRNLLVPWLMGNIILLLFAIGLVAIATQSSRRDDSAIPDEFGNRPNARNKKKKGKEKVDFSKGPVMHPEIQTNLGLTLMGWVTGLPLIFSLPTAARVYQEVKNDPRYKGEGMAQTVLVLNYIGIGVFALLLIGIIVVVAMLVMGGGGS